MITPIAKSKRFRVDAKADFSQKVAVFKFIGSITEETDFEVIQEYVFGLATDIKKVVLDLGEVESANSAGIQGWLKFLSRIQARYRVSLCDISEVLVEYSGIRKDVLGRVGTQVESFKAPYACSKCPNTVSVILKTEAFEGKNEFTPPSEVCVECSCEMFFDHMEDIYSSFLQILCERNSRGKPT